VHPIGEWDTLIDRRRPAAGKGTVFPIEPFYATECPHMDRGDIMRIKIAILFLLSAFVFSSIFTTSQVYAEELKIGYVDVAYIFDNYNKTKDQDEILKEETDSKREERENIVKQIRKMKDELDLLSEEAKKKKQIQIDEKMAQLQEHESQARLNFSQQRDRMMREILKEIEAVIEKYAKENGYTIILNDRILLYSQKEYDLTDRILKILNSKYKRR